MNLIKAAITVAIVGAMSIAGAQEASATLITVDCTSPTYRLESAALRASAVSTCGTLAPLPVGAIVTDVTLSARYSVALQIGGRNRLGRIRPHDQRRHQSSTTVARPRRPWLPRRSSTCSSVPSFARAPPAPARLTALLAGTATITTFATTPRAAQRCLVGDYEWRVNYREDQVPAPQFPNRLAHAARPRPRRDGGRR